MARGRARLPRRSPTFWSSAVSRTLCWTLTFWAGADVIVEASVFVVDDDQQRAFPLRACGQRVVHGQNQVLAVFDVGRGVVVVDGESKWVEVGERRVDPGHRLQRAAGGVFEEAGDLRVDGDVEDGLPRQAGLAEVAEPLMVPQPVMNVGQAQRPWIKRIPAPGDVVDIEVPDKGWLVVEGRHVGRPVIPASSGYPTQGVQAVGQRGTGHRAEPAVADRELFC